MTALIQAQDLAAKLQDPDLVLLDVRWSLGATDHEQRYLEGHIPAARFVDLETELSGTVGEHTGRHPLPLPEDFEAAARSWGINPNSSVVVYDDSGSLAAARAWWLLRHAGFERVQVLDGGLQAWQEAKFVLSTQAPSPTPGTVSLSWGAMPVLEIDQLQEFSGVLIDSRATARYLGLEEPVDPVAGHIPGALNRPTTENLDSGAHFKSSVQLRQGFAALGVTPQQPAVAAYCGSGITAAHQVLALHEAGISAALYPGSWSQYCSYRDLPVATSDETHRT